MYQVMPSVIDTGILWQIDETEMSNLHPYGGDNWHCWTPLDDALSTEIALNLISRCPI